MRADWRICFPDRLLDSRSTEGACGEGQRDGTNTRTYGYSLTAVCIPATLWHQIND